MEHALVVMLIELFSLRVNPFACGFMPFVAISFSNLQSHFKFRISSENLLLGMWQLQVGNVLIVEMSGFSLVDEEFVLAIGNQRGVSENVGVGEGYWTLKIDRNVE